MTAQLAAARPTRTTRADRPGWADPLARVLLAVVVVVATAIVLLPIAIIVFTAFKSIAEVNAFPPSLLPSEPTLDNLVRIFNDLPFGRLIVNSIVFAGGVTLFSLLFDSLAAYALARIDFRGSSLLLGAMIASLMIPFQATLIPVYQLVAGLGGINTYWGLILPRAADAFGIFFLRQFFLALPRDLDNAARIDGASELRILWSIMLPNAVPALVTLGVYNFVNNWNDLLWPLVLTTDPTMGTITSGLALLTGPDGIIPFGVMMAGSLIALLPLAVLFMFLQRRFVASIASTGLK